MWLGVVACYLVWVLVGTLAHLRTCTLACFREYRCCKNKNKLSKQASRVVYFCFVVFASESCFVLCFCLSVCLSVGLSHYFCDTKLYVVNFTKPLPDGVEGMWTVCSFSNRNNMGAVVRRNHFHDGYARVILFKSSNGEVCDVT